LGKTRTTPPRLKRLREWQSFGYSHQNTSFRNVDEKFIPKEIAVVVINATIIGHWIMMPLCSFNDLPEKVK